MLLQDYIVGYCTASRDTNRFSRAPNGTELSRRAERSTVGSGESLACLLHLESLELLPFREQCFQVMHHWSSLQVLMSELVSVTS